MVSSSNWGHETITAPLKCKSDVVLAAVEIGCNDNVEFDVVIDLGPIGRLIYF